MRISESIRQYLLCICAILLLSNVAGIPSSPNLHMSAPLNFAHSSSQISLHLTPLPKAWSMALASLSFVKAKTQISKDLLALLIIYAKSSTFVLCGKNIALWITGFG